MCVRVYVCLNEYMELSSTFSALNSVSQLFLTFSLAHSLQNPIEFMGVKIYGFVTGIIISKLKTKLKMNMPPSPMRLLLLPLSRIHRLDAAAYTANLIPTTVTMNLGHILHEKFFFIASHRIV